MKTISGKPISEKPISLSKAAKILSKFISAENGASHVISAYLHRASSSFSELKQLHKELKSPRSDRKHKRSRSKTHNGKEKIEEINEQLNQRAVHRFGSKGPCEDGQKSSQTIVKFNQEPDGATEYHAGTEGGSETLKKKKKKHGIKFQEQGDNGVEIGEVEVDRKPRTEARNEIEEKPTHGGLDFSQEPTKREKHKEKKEREDESNKNVAGEVKFEEGSNEGNAGDDKGLVDGKKHKQEKKKKKDKDITFNFSGKEGEVIKPEYGIASTEYDQKGILSNGVENKHGDSVDKKELPSKKKKRRVAGSGDKINTDEVKGLQKKRKNEDGEGRDDAEPGEPTRKKIKKKHGGDD